MCFKVSMTEWNSSQPVPQGSITVPSLKHSNNLERKTPVKAGPAASPVQQAFSLPSQSYRGQDSKEYRVALFSTLCCSQAELAPRGHTLLNNPGVNFPQDYVSPLPEQGIYNRKCHSNLGSRLYPVIFTNYM